MTDKPAHTDHPLRHWDRTCPACIREDVQPTKKARMAESHEHAGEQDGQLSQCGPHTDATHQDGPASPAPDKALPEEPTHKDECLTSATLQHGDCDCGYMHRLHAYIGALRQRADGLEGERDNFHERWMTTCKQLAEQQTKHGSALNWAKAQRDVAEEKVKELATALTAERQKNEGLARDAERYRWIASNFDAFLSLLDNNHGFEIELAIDAARSRQGADSE